MNKIFTFLYVLRKTLSSPSYYSDVLKSPFSFSLKFFIFYFVLYALIGTGIFVPKYVLPLKDFLSFLPSKLEQAFPSELEIKIINGEVSTNVPEPYYLPLKNIERIFSEEADFQQTQGIKNLLVIDTGGSVENFHSYETIVLLTKKNIATGEEEGGFRIVPLAKVKDLTVNRTLVKSLLSQLSPFLNAILPLSIITIFILLFIFIPPSKMFYLLFFALIILLVAKIFSVSISYVKSYQIGMHLIIVPTTIFGVLWLLGVSPSFPFLQTIILTIASFIVLRSIKNKKEIKVVVGSHEEPESVKTSSVADSSTSDTG